MAACMARGCVDPEHVQLAVHLPRKATLGTRPERVGVPPAIPAGEPRCGRSAGGAGKAQSMRLPVGRRVPATAMYAILGIRRSSEYPPMRLAAAVLCPLLLLLALPLHAATVSDAATHDQPPDAEHPAVNRQVLVPSAGEGMNALFLLASGAGPKPTVVLLHGLPGNERNLDLAQAMRRAGWNVLTFHYRGSWGSPGKFSIAGAVQDAEAAMQYVRQPDIASRYSIDTSRLVIAGHSMGGYAAARYAATHADVAGLILLDAWDAGQGGKYLRANPAEQARLTASFDDLGNILNGADAQSLTSDVLALADDQDLESLAPGLALHPTLSVWADKGIAAPNAALASAIAAQRNARITTANLPTDHSFADHRIALAQVVVDWLEQLAEPSL